MVLLLEPKLTSKDQEGLEQLWKELKLKNKNKSFWMNTKKWK
jgi:hypothetical protein